MTPVCFNSCEECVKNKELYIGRAAHPPVLHPKASLRHHRVSRLAHPNDRVLELVRFISVTFLVFGAGVGFSECVSCILPYELSPTRFVLKASKSNRWMEFVLNNPGVMSDMITNRGVSLSEASDNSPVLLIFLRHFGCTFCREALADISDLREDIERLGVRIIFVHMTDNHTADPFFLRFGLDGAEHISDPMCQYYAAFGLVKGSYRQLYGLRSWIRGFESIVVEGNGYGAELGDGFQMPGIFVVHKRQIRGSFIHKYSSDRPDYVALTKSCL